MRHSAILVYPIVSVPHCGLFNRWPLNSMHRQSLKHFFCGSLVSLLAACAQTQTKAEMPVFVAQPKCSHMRDCTVQDAVTASLEALKSNKQSLVVSCEWLNGEPSLLERETCRKQIQALPAFLSTRWRGVLVALEVTDDKFEEQEACVCGTTFQLCYPILRAEIPLVWSASPQS